MRYTRPTRQVTLLSLLGAVAAGALVAAFVRHERKPTLVRSLHDMVPDVDLHPGAIAAIGAVAALGVGGYFASKQLRKGPGDSTTVEESIEVDVPVRTAYNQWTQFESFPQFMASVESVNQIDDTHLHWRAVVGG